MSSELPELAERVARYPIESGEWDMELHDWEKGCYVNGLLATDLFVDDARRLTDRAVETQTSEGCLDYGSFGETPLGWEPEWSSEDMSADDVLPVNPTVMGHGVLEFYDRTGESHYLEAARDHFEYLQDLERTENGGISVSYGRNVPSKVLLIDSLYHLCRFFSAYGLLADDDEAFDEAVRQIVVHTDRLYDRHTGLYRQGWRETPNSFNQSTFWGRGMGWLTTALADTLYYLPADYSGRSELEEMFEDVSRTLLDYQDRSGYWRNIIDDPESPFEASSTLMFSYSFMRGIDMGVLSGSDFETAAKEAMSVCEGLVDKDGRVRRVSSVPGGPKSPLKPQLLGQGWFLLAAGQFL